MKNVLDIVVEKFAERVADTVAEAVGKKIGGLINKADVTEAAQKAKDASAKLLKGLGFKK